MSKARVIESPVDAIEFGSGGALPDALSGASPARSARIPIEIRSFALISTPPLLGPEPCHHDPRSSAAQGHGSTLELDNSFESLRPSTTVQIPYTVRATPVDLGARVGRQRGRFRCASRWGTEGKKCGRIQGSWVVYSWESPAYSFSRHGAPQVCSVTRRPQPGAVPARVTNSAICLWQSRSTAVRSIRRSNTSPTLGASART